MPDRLFEWLTPSPDRGRRLASFLILSAVVLVFGIAFYHLIKQLILPLFMAAALAMLAAPYQYRLSRALGNRPNVAASIITVLILVLIIAPLVLSVYISAVQMGRLAQAYSPDGKMLPLLNVETSPLIQSAIHWFDGVSPIPSTRIREYVAAGSSGVTGSAVYARTMQMLGNLPEFLLDIFMFVVALYFFIADGPRIAQSWEELTPMAPDHDRVIRNEFVKVCRGVVLGTVVAAAVQGMATGFGILVLDLIFDLKVGSLVVLLTMLATVLSMVPFVGAGAVWVVMDIVFIVQQQYVAAIILAIYGVFFVSIIDNIVKIVFIKDSAGMHPLLTFVCVFGGLQMLGLLGVFIGPLVGAVLFALLRVLKLELHRMDPATTPPPPVKPQILGKDEVIA